MNARPLQTLTGSCHCQRVRFRVETDFPELTTCDMKTDERLFAYLPLEHSESLADQERCLTLMKEISIYPEASGSLRVWRMRYCIWRPHLIMANEIPALRISWRH